MKAQHQHSHYGGDWPENSRDWQEGGRHEGSRQHSALENENRQGREPHGLEYYGSANAYGAGHEDYAHAGQGPSGRQGHFASPHESRYGGGWAPPEQGGEHFGKPGVFHPGERQGLPGTAGHPFHAGDVERGRKGPKGYVRSDERLRELICERLTLNAELDVCDVSVEVEDGKVRLEGTVPERRMKHIVEDIADACWGVQDVENRIRVQAAGSTAGGTMSAGGASATPSPGLMPASSRNTYGGGSGGITGTLSSALSAGGNSASLDSAATAGEAQSLGTAGAQAETAGSGLSGGAGPSPATGGKP